MKRIQVQLTEQQAAALRRAARARGTSAAAVVRELVDADLGAADAASLARARAVVGRFASGRADTSREHDRELDQTFAE